METEEGDRDIPSFGGGGGGLFTLERNGNYGQYLKATEDIPAGTLILEESPAFFGPSADYVEDYSTPICLGCAVVMNDGNEESRCSFCKWPLCGPHCDNVAYHSNFECDLFAKEKVPFPPANLPIQNCYKGLTILRGLLLQEKDPAMWEKVMNLQYRNEIKTEVEEQDFSEFRKEFGLPNFSSNELWARILGVLNVNSYSIQRIEKKMGSPSFAEFIYPFQCLMNHSCVPNCNWAITYSGSSPSFAIRARASVDIKRGEMLTVAYNYDLVKYGCQKRQQRIREQAKFSCRCALCQDETDFGTFAAAVVCFKCKKGLMLPETDAEESDWKCNECPYKMCQSFVSSFVDSLQEQVEMAQSEETDEEIVEVLEDFISDKSGTVLHPNHWVLTAASWAVVNHLSTKLKELSLDQLDRLIWHCEHILKIRNVVTPGISTEKGILQHHIARAKFTRMEMAIQQKVLLNAAEIEEEIKIVYSLQKYAAIFWNENPHYGTLHANYKQDAQYLIQEMEQLKSKYSLDS